MELSLFLFYLLLIWGGGAEGELNVFVNVVLLKCNFVVFCRQQFCRKLNKELEDTSYTRGTCEFPLSSETCSNASKPRRSFESSEASCSKLPLDVLASTTSHKSLGIVSGDTSHGVVPASQDLAGAVQDEPSNASDISPSLPTAQLLVLPIGIKKFLNLSMALILVVEDQELQVEPDQLKTSPVGVNIRLPMGTLPDVFVRGPESPLEFRVLSAATSGRQVISVALYKWPCDPVSEKFSSYIDKEVNACPSADPAITRPSDADQSGADPKNDVGSTSCATLVQSEADITVDAKNLSSEATEPKGTFSLGSDGDYQAAAECDSGLSVTPTCGGTKIFAPESETVAVTVLSDEFSSEDQKCDVTSLESGIGLEALNETTSAPHRVDAAESSEDAVDHDGSNILESQSSDKVNLPNSCTDDDAGSIEVDPIRVSEECSKISSDAVGFTEAHQG